MEKFLKELRDFKYLEFIKTIYFRNYGDIIDLPNNGVLKKLYLNSVFTNGLSIPNTVKEIHFLNRRQICDIDVSTLPPSVKTIVNLEIIENQTERILNLQKLPNTVKKLVFSSYSNKENLSAHKIPDTIETLVFHRVGCALKIGDIPYGVKTLNLGLFYYHPLPENVLPESITDLVVFRDLKLKHQFFLPKNLKWLSLESWCGIEVNLLPTSITNLTLKLSDTLDIEINSIPNSVIDLEIILLNNRKSISNLYKGIFPNSIKYLKLQLNNVPTFKNDIFHNGLVELDIRNCIYNDDEMIIPGMLPSSILKLKLPKTYNQPLLIGSIPNFVIELDLGDNFNQELNSNILPSSIKYLKISDAFNHPLSIGSIPNMVETLIFGSCYCNSEFNQIIDKVGIFPSSCTYLDFYCPKFTFTIDKPNILPPYLITLIRPIKIKHLITDNALPKSLKFLKN